MPFTVTIPFQTPTDGTCRLSATRSILSDDVSAVRRLFSDRYSVSSMALTNAPSSNTLQNLTISPFGPESSTPWTNGRLASPSCRLPTSYKSKTLVFPSLYMHCVSGITATSLGKTPSPRVGVYSPLACLNPSPGSGSSCSGISTRPVSSFGVVEEASCSTSTTPPLFPDESAVEGMLVPLRRMYGLRWIPQLRG